MPKPVRTQPDLADIVALARALERDDQRTTRELRERESRLARELPGTSDDRVSVALVWLDAVEHEDEVVRTTHQRAHTAVQVTGFVIAIAAVLVGWAATLAAFYFDGTGRVNAVAVVAVMVGVPGLMLVPFLFATLPPDVTRRLPGAATIAALARALSPGRLGQWVWRRMTREAGERTALVLDRANNINRCTRACRRGRCCGGRNGLPCGFRSLPWWHRLSWWSSPISRSAGARH